MSKSKTILAGLGVVAALGVAALPLASFAEETVSGNVQLDVEVLPAISMTISGNNDGGTHSGGTFTAVSEVEVGVTDVSTYYELSGHTYALTEDSTAQDGKTYYALTTPTYGEINGVFAPAGAASHVVDGYTNGAAVDTDTSSSYTSLLPYDKVEGDRSALASEGTPVNNFGSTITVFTNNNSGYTLSVKDADANTDLTHVSGGFYIPATADGVVVAAGTAGWNYDVTRSGLAALTAKAMTASNVAIDTLSTKTSGGRITYVDYNVATAGDQATGIYTDTIVYTATTNN